MNENERLALLELAYAARSASWAAIQVQDEEILEALKSIEAAHAELRQAEIYVRKISLEVKR